jgi:hypothetical protein
MELQDIEPGTCNLEPQTLTVVRRPSSVVRRISTTPGTLYRYVLIPPRHKVLFLIIGTGCIFDLSVGMVRPGVLVHGAMGGPSGCRLSE